MPDRDDRYESGLDDELIDLRTDLQSALARAAQAESEVVELRGATNDLLEALTWASGAPEFSPGREAREGWEGVAVPAISRGESALASPSPAAEAMGRVVEAAERMAGYLREDPTPQELLKDLRQTGWPALAEHVSRVAGTYHALQAARKGGGRS